jgi:hypothetical protein
MLSRRGFLIGTGGLLTMAFVSDTRAFIRRKEAPLLAVPPRTAHTLYWDWPDGLDEPQLFLDDQPEVIAPDSSPVQGGRRQSVRLFAPRACE